jgi:competence protein ComEC
MSKRSPTQDPPRPPACATAPVLWSLLPLATGILIARDGWTWLLPVCALLILLACQGIPPARRTVVGLGFLAGSGLALTTAENPHPDWLTLPQREASFTLRVEEMFHARRPRCISGIGKLLQTDIPHDTASSRRAAFYLETESPPAAGQVLQCRGVLTYLPALDSPDAYQVYLINRDIFLSINRGKVLPGTTSPPRLSRLRLKAFNSSRDRLLTGSADDTSPGRVLASMLLGSRSLLNDDRVRLYRRSGTYHLFAVSGLHVGCVALFIGWICSLLRMPVRWRLALSLLATWYYVWLTGSSPSAVRAGIMISCMGAGRELLRQPHLFPALAFSAWIVLILDPRQLLSLGFQLSYGVVASIVLIGIPLADAIKKIFHGPVRVRRARPPWRYRLSKLVWAGVDLLCISISASLASVPLILQHFQLFTPVSVLLGVLLNPLASLVIMAGSMIILGGPLASVPVGWLARATWPLIRLMEFLLESGLRIPGSSMELRWSWPPTGTLLLVAMLAAAWGLQALRQGTVPLPAYSHLVPPLLITAGMLVGTVGT